ncbi:hypothetical protein HZB00_02160 [Candidatus Woesearchaeota archaeon]|nr:hypothetical protein [Candidatus Woesearchaeota archaeon]
MKEKQKHKDPFEEAVQVLASYRDGLPKESSNQPCCAGCEETKENQWRKKKTSTK